MSYIIFSFIMLALIAEDFIGFYLSNVRGLAFRNISIYFAIIALIPRAFRFGFPKIPLFSLVIVVFLWTLTSLMAVHFYSPLGIPLFNNLIHFKNGVAILMVLYVIVFFVSRNRKESETLLFIILMLFSLCCILSLSQILTGIQIFQTAEHYITSTRFTGFGNPNKTSYYLVFLIPLYYYFYRTRKSYGIKTTGIC